MPQRSARAVTRMPWLSTQGYIRSGWRQGASGQAQWAQMAQLSVEGRIPRARRRPPPGRGLAGDVLMGLAGGEGLLHVRSVLHLRYGHQQQGMGPAEAAALHSATVPTAGGQAQVVLYMGHSVSQMCRTFSLKGISAVSRKAYW